MHAPAACHHLARCFPSSRCNYDFPDSTIFETQMVYKLPQELGPVGANREEERGIEFKNMVSEGQVEVISQGPLMAGLRNSLGFCDNHLKRNEPLEVMPLFDLI